MTKSKIIATVGLLALAILFVYHRRSAKSLKAEIDGLQLALTQAREELASANSTAGTEAADLERLAKDRSELMRLRAEVTALRAQIQQTGGSVPPPKKAASAELKPPAPPVIPSNFRTYNSSITTSVPIGGAAITGGWVTAPGKRTYVFTSPSVVDQSGAPGTGVRQVTMSNKIVEVPDGALQLTFPNVTHNPTDDTYSGSIGANDMHDILAKLETTEGVNVLAAPRVLTNEGMDAEVAVTHTVVQDDQEIALGPKVTLSSRISPDGSFTMSINSKLTLLPTE